MGKYSDILLKDVQDTYKGRNLQLKLWMVNELAEANRLKRLELRQKNTHFDSTEGSFTCSIEDELVDQV